MDAERNTAGGGKRPDDAIPSFQVDPFMLFVGLRDVRGELQQLGTRVEHLEHDIYNGGLLRRIDLREERERLQALLDAKVTAAAEKAKDRMWSYVVALAIAGTLGMAGLIWQVIRLWAALRPPWGGPTL